MSLVRRVFGLGLLTLLIALPAAADDKKPTTPPKPEEAKKADAKPAEAKKDAAPEQDMSAMMAEMEKMAAAGPQHEALKPLVGSWKAACKFWMDPSQPPMVSAGSFERKMVLGGRYLMEEFTGTFLDKPFNGIGYTGFDNISNKYVATWMDSSSTGIMTMTGTADPSGKTITLISDKADPMMGLKTKSVLKIINNDKHTFEMFMVGLDGKDIKNFEIESTRK